MGTFILIVIAISGFLLVRKQIQLYRKEEHEMRQAAARAAEVHAADVAYAAAALRAKQERECREKILIVAGESLSLFETIPLKLTSAERCLDQAEADFSESAFAPFWDSIENAANVLGDFEKLVQGIKGKLSEYTVLSSAYPGDTPPAFPLELRSIEKLSVGAATAERMKRIVRQAQSNFQFALIYEQRKTNRVLIAGFTNLGQALDRMTWKITESISDLAGSVQTMTSTLGESMHEMRSDMLETADMASQQRELLIKNASESSVREQHALIMLDNIQRGRRP